MPKLNKPGTDNLPAGTYIERDRYGGRVDHPRTVRIDHGDRLPPTQEKGHTWVKK